MYQRLHAPIKLIDATIRLTCCRFESKLLPLALQGVRPAMIARADWIVVGGFLLAVSGVALRIVMMMRFSDTHPAHLAAIGGRDLLRSYGTAFPKSRLPLAMWISLTAGLVLLIAGLLLELR